MPKSPLTAIHTAVDLTDQHVRDGNPVNQDDAALTDWLKYQPYSWLLTIEGYAAHVTKHSQKERARRKAAGKYTGPQL